MLQIGAERLRIGSRGDEQISHEMPEVRKPATFHITDLVDGKPNELHLCEECAHKFLAPSSDEAAEVLPAMAGLLAQHLAVGETAEELARLDQRSCPVCGITFLEFRKQGRLGCPHDYVCFAKELEPLLLNIHGETQHVGKVPKSARSGAEAADAADPPAPRNEGSDRGRRVRTGLEAARRDPQDRTDARQGKRINDE